MEIIICPDGDQVARVAAETVAQVVRRVGPSVVLGLATGSSPLGLYEQLAERVAAGELDVSQATGFALDEYVGMPPGHPESYAEVIRRTVTEPLGLDPARVHVPGQGRTEDIDQACRDYEQAIVDAGGVDIQILGIGTNGHIGFNEPSSSLSSRTRIKTLTPRTRAAHARFFDSLDEVPVHCLTQGLGTIMDADEVVLVATGTAKASAIAALVEGPITAMVPGSILQLHRYATIVIDELAASELAMTSYYRWAMEHKPVWQGYGQN